MDTTQPLRIAVIGCGCIAGPYADNASRHPDKLQLVGAFDLVPERTQAFVSQYGGEAFDSLEELLACDEVEAVVNLTLHTAHAGVSRLALEAGKHVHSEKPLATSRDQARELVELADARNVQLGCSPFVILGEAQQTLWQAIRQGLIGEPLEAVGYIMHARIEKGLATADVFLSPGAGPVLDVGCYPLNVLTSIFGPVSRVRGASADILIPNRTFHVGPRTGETFQVTTPDHATGLLEFATGMPGRLGASFSVSASSLPGIEVYGTEGSLSMSNAFLFNAEVKFRSGDDPEWRPVPFVSEPFNGVDWSRGLVAMFEAVRHHQPLPCDGRQAEHILDICLTLLEAAQEGGAKSLSTSFRPSAPVWV